MIQASPLSEGTPAPPFSYRDRNGDVHESSALNGRPFVLYFYPRDNTPGCTKEACEFRDHYEAFTEHGVEVIAVSADDEKSHGKFRDKFDLPFPMIADTEQAICRAYGVWGEKKFMGKTFEGVHRVTFLVGPDGRVLRVYPKVKPGEHAPAILNDIKELS